mmetsp:Transcript_62190/g.98933  ORF Transcript_62190/g.98933 Transcript_62190/m.98933 type:complete len:147 (-) Transcript_62190:1209-1649(-)
MTKGTWSKGKRNRKSHALCPRCGRRALHCKKKQCAACGFPNSKIRKYNWCTKARRRKRTGTGRMRYLRRALKRRRNIRKFEALSPILKSAILKAKEQTSKSTPPKREVQKQVRKIKNKISKKRDARQKFIDSLQAEIDKRLSAKAN